MVCLSTAGIQEDMTATGVSKIKSEVNSNVLVRKKAACQASSALPTTLST